MTWQDIPPYTASLSHRWPSVLALVFGKCVWLLGLLETGHRPRHRNVRRKRCLTKICSLERNILYKLKWGMFPITADLHNFSLNQLYWSSSLFYSSESDSGFIFVLDSCLDCTGGALMWPEPILSNLLLASVCWVSQCPHVPITGSI